MVSRLPVFSGKRVGKRVPPEMVLPVFVVVVLFFALLVSYPWEVLSLGTFAYLGCLPLGWLSYRNYLRKDAEAAGATNLTAADATLSPGPGRVRRRRTPAAIQLAREPQPMPRATRVVGHGQRHDRPIVDTVILDYRPAQRQGEGRPAPRALRSTSICMSRRGLRTDDLLVLEDGSLVEVVAAR